MVALGNWCNTQILHVFPLLKSSETNTADLRTDSTNAGAVTSVFSNFIKEWGWDILSVLPEIAGRTLKIKHIVNCNNC